MAMNFHDYPYTDLHEMNLDWCIAKVKELTEAWLQTRSDWEDTQQAWEDMKDYINNYFDNLNVQTEINNKIDALVEDGTLSDLIAPYVASGLPAVVADQISAVVAAQIGDVVAAQISAVVAAQLPAVVATETAGQAAAWLETHVDPDTGYVIDDSLTIQGAAADAKATGDAVTELNNALSDLDASLRNVAKGNNYNDYQRKLSLAVGKLTPTGSVVLDGITCHTTAKLAAYNHEEDTNYGIIFNNTVYKVDILGYTNSTDTASDYDSGYVTISPLGLYLQSKEYVALNIRRIDGGTIADSDLNTITNAIRYYYVVGNLLATRQYVTDANQLAVSVAKEYTDSVAGKATVVTVGDDKDYQSLRTCLDYIQTNGNGKPYVVNIDPGTYDIRSYYTAEERADSNFIGMSIPNNVTLVGVGGAENTLLKWDGSEDTASSKISTLNIRNVASLEGVTVYGNNIRYVVHDDFATSGTKNIRNVKDCIFRGENLVYDHVYGSGEKGNAFWTFENCHFFAPVGKVAFMQHNNTNETESSYLTFDNCRFVGSSNNCIVFSSMNTGTTAIVHVTMKGNRLLNTSGTSASVKLNENNAAAYGAGIKYKVNGFGNSLNQVIITNTDGVDYSSYIDLI